MALLWDRISAFRRPNTNPSQTKCKPKSGLFWRLFFPRQKLYQEVAATLIQSTQKVWWKWIEKLFLHSYPVHDSTWHEQVQEAGRRISCAKLSSKERSWPSFPGLPSTDSVNEVVVDRSQNVSFTMFVHFWSL